MLKRLYLDPGGLEDVRRALRGDKDSARHALRRTRQVRGTYERAAVRVVSSRRGSSRDKGEGGRGGQGPNRVRTGAREALCGPGRAEAKTGVGQEWSLQSPCSSDPKETSNQEPCRGPCEMTSDGIRIVSGKSELLFLMKQSLEAGGPVEISGSIVGASKKRHTFDLVVTKGSKKVPVDVSSHGAGRVALGEVLETYAKSLDTEVKRSACCGTGRFLRRPQVCGSLRDGSDRGERHGRGS